MTRTKLAVLLLGLNVAVATAGEMESLKAQADSPFDGRSVAKTAVSPSPPAVKPAGTSPEGRANFTYTYPERRTSLPMASQPRRPKHLVKGLLGGMFGAFAGLVVGAAAGMTLGIVDLAQRTKELPGRRRTAARVALLLPAMAAGAVVGQLTYWFSGAKFFWDKNRNA